jgi:multiple sugar transport system substrate-binding protein
MPEETTNKKRRKRIMKRLLISGLVLLSILGVNSSSFAQKPKLSLTVASKFTLGTNEMFRKNVLEWGSIKGVDVSLEATSLGAISTKVAAAAETKGGPDIIEAPAYLAALYADSLIDVDDVATELGKKYGGWYPVNETLSKVNGRWKTIPNVLENHGMVIRTDLLQAAVEKIPSADWTWEDLLRIAKKIKAATGLCGAGFSKGRAVGDANNFAYSVLWSYGGKEVEEDGKTIALDSPETRAALRFVKRLYDEVELPGVLGWDDGSNNKVYLAGLIGITGNSGSIYWAAAKENPYIRKNTTHQVYPRGPVTQKHFTGLWSLGIFKHTKYPELAKDLIRYLFEKDRYEAWIATGEGNISPVLIEFSKHPMWKDPVLKAFIETNNYKAWIGYPGPYTREASQVMDSYIIVDMMAKVCQGVSIDDAIKWAVSEMKKIYK